MAYKFPSVEWTAALEEKINASDAYANAAKTWEGDILFIVEDSHDGIYLDLWHGKCRKSEYVPTTDGVAAEFKISAPQAKWQNVLSGKLDPIQGMVTRQLKLEGNLVKIMKNVKSAQELVKCATQVPTA
ncbi:MAG: SCP2 sterol-binding domain-containing protein [Caldilineaceae bacterium]